MASSSAPQRNRVQPAPGVTPEDRDPNNINDHIKIDFYSIMGEPKGMRSFDCVWELSETFYECCKSLMYGVSTLCCGVCIAIAWGIEFVPTVFASIWCFTPCHTHLYNTCTLCFKPVCTICARCFIAPFCKSAAYLFRECGDGEIGRIDSPDIFPKSTKRARPPPQPKPEVKKDEPEKKIVPAPVPVRASIGEYDKDKMVRSVKRQMMLV